VDTQVAEGGRHDSGAVVQTRSEAWSQVPCAIQWLQSEAAPQPDSNLKEYFHLRDLAVA
jgi:hypothetical protein